MSTGNGFFPHRPRVEEPDCEPELVDIDDAGDVFEVLASTTARAILAELYREPAPASEVADRVDTSLQNVTYHVDRLRRVDLVDVVDTWYSSRGNEMKVYAPTNEPLVLVAGDPEEREAVDRALHDPPAATPDDPVAVPVGPSGAELPR